MMGEKERPHSEGRGFNVLFVYADSALEWNCSQWRMLTPANAMNRHRDQGWQAKLVHVASFLHFLDPAVQEWCAQADLIIFQRNVISAEAIDAMRYWQLQGKPVVIDLDDAYTLVPPSNPAYGFWIANRHNLDPSPLAMLEMGLRQSDGLISPNRLILQDWQHATRGFYLPNFADQDFWRDLPSHEEAKKALNLPLDRIVIGWGGSTGHLDSWWGSGIRQAAQRIANRHPEVLFLICGNDMRIYHSLDISRHQKRVQPGVPPNMWPRIVRAFDIGIAPLAGPFDQRRSWIKGLEYLLAGVPWVATRGEPYRDLQEFGVMVDNGPDAWEAALEEVIQNLTYYRERAEHFRPVAWRWTADEALDVFSRVYGHIIETTTDRRGVLPYVWPIRTEPVRPESQES